MRVAEIDVNDRVHFSVIEDQGVAGSGDMSNSAFVSRFSRIEAVQSACARIRHLGYVAYNSDCMVSEDDAEEQVDRAINSITLESSAAPATKPHPFAEP